MANIRSVSLYSYQELFFFHKIDLEGMIAEASKAGARGIELIAEQNVPREYKNPSPEFIENWKGWMEKYNVTPSCLDIFGDYKIYYNRDLTKREQIEMFESNFQFAQKLGFPTVRAMIGTPLSFIPDLQALAETYGVKFGIEMHAPYNFSTPYFQKYMEMIEKSGSSYLGIIPDMSIFTIRVPQVQMGKFLRSGAHPEIVDTICSSYAEGLSVDKADEKIAQMGANEWDYAAMKTAYNGCNEDPQNLMNHIDKVIHIHGKAYDMSEDCRETSMDYETVLPLLKEHDYTGFISTEYEGQRFFHDLGTGDARVDEIEQVRRHQVMMKKLLGE